VRAEVVHDDDVAGLEGWHRLLVHIGAKRFAIDGAVEHTWRGEPIAAQRAQKGECPPAAMGREAVQALPLRPPATAVRRAIECAGAELRFLPPYSPDFNPIEMAFSKLKAFLKKHAARTVDDLWDTIAMGIGTFTPTECQNYFAAAGYDCE
jgi:hypothetical protein